MAKLAKAGFDNIDIEPTRVYITEDARAFLSARGLDIGAALPPKVEPFLNAKPSDQVAKASGSGRAHRQQYQIPPAKI
jgi:hypothetical protein